MKLRTSVLTLALPVLATGCNLVLPGGARPFPDPHAAVTDLRGWFGPGVRVSADQLDGAWVAGYGAEPPAGPVVGAEAPEVLADPASPPPGLVPPRPLPPVAIGNAMRPPVPIGNAMKPAEAIAPATGSVAPEPVPMPLPDPVPALVPAPVYWLLQQSGAHVSGLVLTWSGPVAMGGGVGFAGTATASAGVATGVPASTNATADAGGWIRPGVPQSVPPVGPGGVGVPPAPQPDPGPQPRTLPDGPAWLTERLSGTDVAGQVHLVGTFGAPAPARGTVAPAIAQLAHRYDLVFDPRTQHLVGTCDGQPFWAAPYVVGTTPAPGPVAPGKPMPTVQPGQPMPMPAPAGPGQPL